MCVFECAHCDAHNIILSAASVLAPTALVEKQQTIYNIYIEAKEVKPVK